MQDLDELPVDVLDVTVPIGSALQVADPELVLAGAAIAACTKLSRRLDKAFDESLIEWLAWQKAA